MMKAKRLPYQRYKLVVQYDGSDYVGWQQQKDEEERGIKSVQRVLQDVISKNIVFADARNKINGRNVRDNHRKSNDDGDDDEEDEEDEEENSEGEQVLQEEEKEKVASGVERYERHRWVVCNGSSRTDAGVHAVAQTCHVDLCKVDRRTGAPIPATSPNSNSDTSQQGQWEQYDPSTLRRALNHALRDERIRVVHVEKVHSKYNARRAATGRTYMYRMQVNSPTDLSLERGRVWFLNRATWLFKGYTNRVPIELNLDAMKQACQTFVGKHDFSCFAAISACNGPVRTVRTLQRFDMEVRQHDEVDTIPPGESFPGFKPYEIRFHLAARSFLHHQVRIMVHAVVLVGLGRLTSDDIRNMLANERSRNKITSRMAPADGLYLMRVFEGSPVPD